MKIISSFLKEFYPDNPNQIILKNKYYPSGLREIDIYNHYLKYKDKILKWIDNRNVGFFINVDNQRIMKRKIENRPIVLTKKNFKDLITGRTNLIFVEHPSPTDYYIIDVDPGKNISRNDVIKIIEDINKHAFLKMITRKKEVLITSSVGFHIIGITNHKRNINIQRQTIERILNFIVNDKKYHFRVLVNKKGRDPNTINLDLSPMYKRSLHLAKFSLTKEGLICDDISKGLQITRTK